MEKYFNELYESNDEKVKIHYDTYLFDKWQSEKDEFLYLCLAINLYVDLKEDQLNEFITV